MRPWLSTLAAVALLADPAFAAPPRPPAEVAAELDREIDRRLAEAKVPPSPPASDAEFLRRASLDLTGRLPTPERAVVFLDSSDPDKRGKLVDELVDSPLYGQRFAAYWAELFVKRNDTAGKPNAAPFREWLAGEFNRGAGWDEVVAAMLTVQGDAPEKLFLLTNKERDIAPNRVAGTVGALFMGVQLGCAECHRHPVTKAWRREDFWGTAAFFARTRATEKKDAKGQKSVVIEDAGESPRAFVARPDPKKPPPAPGDFLPPGVVEIPDATDPMKRVGRAPAVYLGAGPADLGPTGSHRGPFAAWLTAPANPFFARAFANRTWSVFFARGLVTPVDDMHADNPPSHPGALDVLARELAAAGFDGRHLARSVCRTRAYGRSSAAAPGNENDTTLLSRMPVKAVRGPALLDLHDQVLGTPRGSIDPQVKVAKGEPKPTATRDLLDTAGYDESPDEYTAGVPQALRLMNTVLPTRTAAAAAMIARTGGPADKAAKDAERSVKGPGTAVPSQPLPRERAVERVYLALLSRRPTPAEASAVAAFLDARPGAEGFDGLLWALASSPEFVSVP